MHKSQILFFLASSIYYKCGFIVSARPGHSVKWVTKNFDFGETLTKFVVKTLIITNQNRFWLMINHNTYHTSTSDNATT